MMADIAFADRAQKRVRDRMADHIRIRVAFESALVRYLDAA
jgi:hypothetical protein